MYWQDSKAPLNIGIYFTGSPSPSFKTIFGSILGHPSLGDGILVVAGCSKNQATAKQEVAGRKHLSSADMWKHLGTLAMSSEEGRSSAVPIICNIFRFSVPDDRKWRLVDPRPVVWFGYVREISSWGALSECIVSSRNIETLLQNMWPIDSICQIWSTDLWLRF